MKRDKILNIKDKKMTKIIGFLVSKENKEPKVDFFDIGIKTILIQHKKGGQTPIRE